MLILATRVDQTPRYRLDLLNCLAYPEGVAVRFTYQRRWIDRQIRSDGLVKGTAGLIVLYDPPSAKGSEYPFLPVRWMTFEGFEPPGFVDIENESLLVAVRFNLGRYVNIDAAHEKEWLAYWQKCIESYAERPRPDQHDGRPTHLMFPLPDMQDSPPQGTDKAWQLIASQAGKLTSLREATLFRVSGFCPERSPGCEQFPLAEYGGTKWLEVKSGTTSVLALDFYLDPARSAPPSTLAPRSSSTTLTISQPILTTAGANTKANIFVSSPQTYSDEATTLVIDDPQDIKTLSPRVEFAVKIKKRRGLLLWVIALLAFGALAAGISADTLKELWSSGWMNQHAEEVSTAVRIVGSASVGFAGYLGFRKIPGG